MTYAEPLSIIDIVIGKQIDIIRKQIENSVYLILQRIPFTTFQSATSIERVIGERLIKGTLNKYVKGEDLEKILEITGDRVGDLLGTAYYVEKHYGHYGGPRLTLLEFEEDYEETGEKWVVIGLVLRDCGYEEWDMIENDVKESMRERGFEELAGRVLVVCVRGLKEMLS